MTKRRTRKELVELLEWSLKRLPPDYDITLVQETKMYCSKDRLEYEEKLAEIFEAIAAEPA